MLYEYSATLLSRAAALCFAVYCCVLCCVAVLLGLGCRVVAHMSVSFTGDWVGGLALLSSQKPALPMVLLPLLQHNLLPVLAQLLKPIMFGLVHCWPDAPRHIKPKPNGHAASYRGCCPTWDVNTAWTASHSLSNVLYPLNVPHNRCRW